MLHIVSGNSLAGAERHVLSLAAEQRSLGCHVHVAFRQGGWLNEELATSGLPYTPMPLRGTLDPVSLSGLVRLVRRERIDFIHGHLARGMVYAYLTGAVTGRPSVGTDHLSNPNWVMRRLSHVVVLSVEGHERAICAGVDPNRISLVANGVDQVPLETDAEDAGSLRASWSIPDGSPVFGILARLSPVKGHDTALKALARMTASPEPVLVMAGPGEAAWVAQLQQTAAALGISDRVRFLGPVRRVGAFLAACDVVLAPSRQEACPLSVLEAMMLGRPIIASSVGGLADIIEHGDTGWLVAPDDDHALAAAMNTALTEVRLRLAWGSAARRAATRMYSARTMAGYTLDVYRRAMVGALAMGNPGRWLFRS